MFVVCCNSCGTAGETVYGGNSAIIDPWGQAIASAGDKETILAGDCDLRVLTDIRNTIPGQKNKPLQYLKEENDYDLRNPCNQNTKSETTSC